MNGLDLITGEVQWCALQSKYRLGVNKLPQVSLAVEQACLLHEQQQPPHPKSQ